MSIVPKIFPKNDLSPNSIGRLEFAKKRTNSQKQTFEQNPSTISVPQASVYFLFDSYHFFQTKFFYSFFDGTLKRNIRSNKSFKTVVRIEYKNSRRWKPFQADILNELQRTVTEVGLRISIFKLFFSVLIAVLAKNTLISNLSLL